MYDYVIVGAGSAGSVLAARLSEDPSCQVCLLEAGPPDSADNIHIPMAFGKLFKTQYDWDYIYEPDAKTVLDHVMIRYVESLVYQAVLENLASEHAARMVAMKAASDNATKLIGTLQLIYNKARQAAITQEISEIVGGAAAV